ncbi:MAG TPA: RNA polymerase sigma factor [Acidobacteriota bacterium]
MDTSGLEAQLEACHKESYGWALSCCSGNPEETEDVLQAVYLKILERKARFDGRSTFKTWFFSVIRKTVAERRRRRLFQSLMLARHLRRTGNRAQCQDSDENIFSLQFQAAVRRALAALPRRQREALQLVFYHDLSLAETAKVMGISVGSARTHYQRGKRRLRQWLERSRGFNESRLGRRQNQTTVP